MRLLILCLLLASSLATAQIYRTTDEAGNVIFTDKPPATEGAEVESVELNRTNTAPPPEDRPDLAPRAPEPEPENTPDYRVTINAPEDGETIPMGPGNFSVSAGTSPSLSEGETLQLIISGESWQEPQARGQWNLTNIRRGEHDIVVVRLDADGEELAASAPVRILVLRPLGPRPATR